MADMPVYFKKPFKNILSWEQKKYNLYYPITQRTQNIWHPYSPLRVAMQDHHDSLV